MSATPAGSSPRGQRPVLSSRSDTDFCPPVWRLWGPGPTLFFLGDKRLQVC